MNKARIRNETDHSFDSDLATEIGVNASLLGCFICHICKDYFLEEVKEYNNKYWINCSLNDWLSYFNYLGESQIKTALNKLLKRGYIERAFLSEHKWDRTYYYTYTDKLEDDLYHE